MELTNDAMRWRYDDRSYHIARVSRGRIVVLFLYLSPLIRASIPWGAREVMTQKRDCACSRRSAYPYPFRVIAEHEDRVLYLLLSRGRGEQEEQSREAPVRQVGRQHRSTLARSMAGGCLLSRCWVPFPQRCRELPPTSPNNQVERHGLSFPVLDAHEMAKTISASINEEPLYLAGDRFCASARRTVAVAVSLLLILSTFSLKYLQKVQ